MIMIMSIRLENQTRALVAYRLSRGQFDWNRRSKFCVWTHQEWIFNLREDKQRHITFLSHSECDVKNRRTESIVELISRKSQTLAKKKNFVHFLNHHHRTVHLFASLNHTLKTRTDHGDLQEDSWCCVWCWKLPAHAPDMRLDTR